MKTITKYDNGAFTIPGFLTTEECQKLILNSESRGYDLAKIQTSFGEKNLTEVRNNERILFDDFDLAKRLFGAVQEYVPEEINYWKPVGLNERFRFYKYSDKQYFKWHVDGSFIRNYFEASKLTILIYLNQNYSAGETEFEDFKVRPQEGMALIFPHKLRHQGVPIKDGKKYILRSDVMYAKA